MTAKKKAKRYTRFDCIAAIEGPFDAAKLIGVLVGKASKNVALEYPVRGGPYKDLPLDALVGDIALLYSTLLPVKVTSRIAPGVVSIKEGAWLSPGADGTDVAGCANALSDDRSAPCGATTYNTNLVEVAVIGDA